ncbi:Alcohol sulfotransferase [Dirofilaria immitis]
MQSFGEMMNLLDVNLRGHETSDPLPGITYEKLKPIGRATIGSFCLSLLKAESEGKEEGSPIMAFGVPDESLEQIITTFPNIGTESCLTLPLPKLSMHHFIETTCCIILQHQTHLSRKFPISKNISNCKAYHHVRRHWRDKSKEFVVMFRFPNTLFLHLFFHGNAIGTRIFGLAFNLEEILQDLFINSSHGALNRTDFCLLVLYVSRNELLKGRFYDGPKRGVCGRTGMKTRAGTSSAQEGTRGVELVAHSLLSVNRDRRPIHHQTYTYIRITVQEHLTIHTFSSYNKVLEIVGKENQICTTVSEGSKMTIFTMVVAFVCLSDGSGLES